MLNRESKGKAASRVRKRKRRMQRQSEQQIMEDQIVACTLAALGSDLQLLRAVTETVLPSAGLLQHLCTLLLLHLFLVLQIRYLLILVFHLPVDGKREITLFTYAQEVYVYLHACLCQRLSEEQQDTPDADSFQKVQVFPAQGTKLYTTLMLQFSNGNVF